MVCEALFGNVLAERSEVDPKARTTGAGLIVGTRPALSPIMQQEAAAAVAAPGCG
jgi:hypothetical protein